MVRNKKMKEEGKRSGGPQLGRLAVGTGRRLRVISLQGRPGGITAWRGPRLGRLPAWSRLGPGLEPRCVCDAAACVPIDWFASWCGHRPSRRRRTDLYKYGGPPAGSLPPDHPGFPPICCAPPLGSPSRLQTGPRLPCASCALICSSSFVPLTPVGNDPNPTQRAVPLPALSLLRPLGSAPGDSLPVETRRPYRQPGHALSIPGAVLGLSPPCCPVSRPRRVQPHPPVDSVTALHVRCRHGEARCELTCRKSHLLSSLSFPLHDFIVRPRAAHVCEER